MMVNVVQTLNTVIFICSREYVTWILLGSSYFRKLLSGPSQRSFLYPKWLWLHQRSSPSFGTVMNKPLLCDSVLSQINISSSLGEVSSDFVLLAATCVARLVFLHCLFICWCTDPLENFSTQERHHVDFECTLQDFESINEMLIW